MQRLIVGVLLLLVPSGASTLSGRVDPEVMFDRYMAIRSMASGGRIEAHWMADGDRFWYPLGSEDSRTIVVVDASTGAVEPLFDIDVVRRNLSDLLGEPVPGEGLPFETFRFADSSESVVLFHFEGEPFEIRMSNFAVTRGVALGEDRAPDEGIRPIPSPGGRAVLEVREYNLWLRPGDEDEFFQLTYDGESDQVEWAAYDTPVWSPDGAWAAATRWDFRQVEHIPILDWLGDQKQVHWEEAPTPGGLGREVELFLVSGGSGELVRAVVESKPGSQFFILGWARDSSEVYSLRANRGHSRLDLLATDRTGKTRVIITESSETFVVGLDLLEDYPSLFTSAGDEFVWVSERNGWKHLYLYDYQGRLRRRLTSGQWPVERVVSIDQQSGWVYFTGHDDRSRPYDRHLYRVSLAGGPVEKLTDEPGQHRPRFSPSGRFFLDEHSSIDRPWSTDLRRADGTLVRRVAAGSLEVVKRELQWKAPEEFVVLAVDGETDMYGVLYKPWNFDPGKKYPVVEMLYAGPDQTHAPRGFAESVVNHALAQLGFVVVTVDARGTPGRGKAFQDVVYGNFGRHEIPDHVTALKQLFSARPYLDSSRVGVYGYSWGGYFAIRAMLMAPDTYHVGVARSADGDLADHRGQEMVIYMGTPQENPLGYEYGSNLRLAKHLKGRLLLVQGARDGHVPLGATMRLIDALIRAGKPYDLLLLPRGGHSFSSRHEAMYVLKVIRDYFIEHLNP
jgi:dipeptidyl aminopeptidase/acylaminoacyl peptidase